MKNFHILVFLLLLFSCTSNSDKEHNSSKNDNTVPVNPIIELNTKVIDEDYVEFVIETNIPLPIEVMISVDLKDQKPDETYIGASKKLKIESSPFTFMFNIGEYKLPSAVYITDVSFYPNWGANDGKELAKEIESKVVGSSSVILNTSHGTVKETKLKNKGQVWIINNVYTGTTWDKNTFIKELGNYKELTVSNKNPEIIKVYYFQDADMTIFVSKPLKEVLTWRVGKINAL